MTSKKVLTILSTEINTDTQALLSECQKEKIDVNVIHSLNDINNSQFLLIEPSEREIRANSLWKPSFPYPLDYLLFEWNINHVHCMVDLVRKPFIHTSRMTIVESRRKDFTLDLIKKYLKDNNYPKILLRSSYLLNQRYQIITPDTQNIKLEQYTDRYAIYKWDDITEKIPKKGIITLIFLNQKFLHAVKRTVKVEVKEEMLSLVDTKVKKYSPNYLQMRLSQLTIDSMPLVNSKLPNFLTQIDLYPSDDFMEWKVGYLNTISPKLYLNSRKHLATEVIKGIKEWKLLKEKSRKASN